MPKKSQRDVEKSKKGFFSSFRNVFIVALIAFTCGLFTTQWVITKMSKKDIEYGLLLFQKDWAQRLGKNEEIIHTHLNIIYNSLRTIALLPGVQQVDRYGTNFNDSEITVQEIYNNLFSSISVSEIYIVPESLDPDRIDPNTGKPEAPIKSFDNFISGKTGDTEKDKINLEEVEHFEYQEMKKQLEYFHRYFGNVDNFTNLNFPALVSQEIITCDNSEMTALDIEKKNDNPRQGVIYSVPFYGSNGVLRGMITAVLRTSVLSKLLEYPYFILNSNHGFTLSHPDTPQKIHDDLSTLLEEENLPGYAYIKSVPLDIKDEGKWRVITAIPESVWLESSIYKSIKLNSRWIWMIGTLLSLSLATFVWSLMYSRTRALNLLAQMRSALEASQRQLFQTQKSDFMNKVIQQTANDFQSHITPILAYSNLLLGKLTELPGEFKKMEVVKKSAERASQVINQLLLLSKTAVPEKSKINLSEIITKTHQALSQILTDKVVLSLELDPQLFPIMGVASHLEKVIMNLAFNARDAMPSGGKLSLIATNHQESKNTETEVPQLTKGFYVKIVVSDTGTGISEEVLNKMFDSSSQAKSSQVDTGEEIKLFTLHAIVADHKGIILVNSELNKGTTFTVFIPALVDKSMEALLSQPAPETPEQVQEIPLETKPEPPSEAAAETSSPAPETPTPEAPKPEEPISGEPTT